MITENIRSLKIHKLSKEQYKRELSAGNILENEIYLTPDETKLFVFTITAKFDDGILSETANCDKTFSEIIEAYDKNYLIVGIFQNTPSIITDIDSNRIVFFTTYVGETCAMKLGIEIGDDNTINISSHKKFSYRDLVNDLTSDSLNTTNKTIIGSINELYAEIQALKGMN